MMLFSRNSATTKVTPRHNNSSPSTSRKPSPTTPGTCKYGIVLVSEPSTGANASPKPRYFVEPQSPYKPTDINPGQIGVSFPNSSKAYIIILPISPATSVKSVRLPNTTNVNQIRVMFLDENDKPIAAPGSNGAPLQITSTLKKGPKVNVNLEAKVYSVHVTLISTTDNQPPKAVTVEIGICVETPKTTGRTTVSTPSAGTTPAPGKHSTLRVSFTIVSSLSPQLPHVHAHRNEIDLLL